MLSSLRSRAVPLFLVFVAIALGALPTGGAVAAAKDPTTRGSAGCGNAATSGSSTRHVTVDGVQRDYLLSIPSDYRAAKPAPLLFDFHGFTSSMQEQSAYTKFNQQGGARGYVVITPNGQGDLLRRWSLIPAASANPDVAFVQAMLRTTTGGSASTFAASSPPASRTARCSRPCSRARFRDASRRSRRSPGSTPPTACCAADAPRERARVPRHRRPHRALPGW